jgi:purine-binding chemotaxis protein CheW
MHETTSSPPQYLSFSLGGLEYGIDIAAVQELRVLKALERIASHGEILDGVAVSRGVIMPLVDMRAACGPRPATPDPNTDVIILRLSGNVVGLVVDGVTGVVTLQPDQVMALPGIEGVQPGYLLGLAQLGRRRLVLVDIERLMSVKGTVTQGAKQVA